ncbi:DUF3189 family protein [Caldanaerobius polysaccharolyticus]|uniref:DUF3189 family protein n=1 Tax=Caldanaerobius polysaccharolyticus TaxID=44256 RepID=UPI00047B0CB2|nr:DUF3189 family protein [Caldanaerobius polysaccharolyticus]
MIILYHCYGGSHSSIIACWIHLNKLPMDSVPDRKHIESLPLFDQLTSQDYGRIMKIGTDEFGNTICSMGVKNQKDMIIPALKDLYYEIYKNTDGFLDVDTSHAVNLTMKIGGFISRTLKLTALGRPIVALGSIKAYKNIARIVENTKKLEQQATKQTTS